MSAKFRLSVCMLVMSAMCAGTVSAGGRTAFRQVRYFNGSYLMGVSSVEEYDYYVDLYPGVEDALPTFVFYPNGTVSMGTETATYTKTSNTITINYVPPPGGYFTTVQYVLHRDSTTDYWGEILFDGYLYGIMVGQLTN
ncbi:MAG: hypothetical protein KDA91_12635 [Planctomycetaceae bacterium]|nr:hypothetical protein [Planctomycetaceae bacterium]